MRQICLCGRCLRDYITAGYRVRRDWSVMIKDDCEICDRTGFGYIIEEDTKMAKIGTTIKVNIETLFEGKPVELQFVRDAIREKIEREKPVDNYDRKECPTKRIHTADISKICR